MSHPAPSAATRSATRRAAIAVAIWAAAVVAWRVFDTPMQRQVERQIAPEVLAHVGTVVTAFTSLAVALTVIALLRKALAAVKRPAPQR